MENSVDSKDLLEEIFHTVTEHISVDTELASLRIAVMDSIAEVFSSCPEEIDSECIHFNSGNLCVRTGQAFKKLALENKQMTNILLQIRTAVLEKIRFVFENAGAEVKEERVRVWKPDNRQFADELAVVLLINPKERWYYSVDNKMNARNGFPKYGSRGSRLSVADFEKNVLPLLPTKLQETYSSPVPWRKLNDQQIAEKLEKFLPADLLTEWSLNKDRENREKYNFRAHWYRQGLTVADFEGRILPLLSKERRDSYCPVMPWSKLSDERIAEELGKLLSKNPKRWGLGSLVIDDRAIGFYKFWKKNEWGETEFRKRILIHMRTNLINTFKPNESRQRNSDVSNSDYADNSNVA